jgi:hypothetical protein
MPVQTLNPGLKDPSPGSAMKGEREQGQIPGLTGSKQKEEEMQ